MRSQPGACWSAEKAEALTVIVNGDKCFATAVQLVLCNSEEPAATANPLNKTLHAWQQ